MPRRKHDFYETPPHYLKALNSVLEFENWDRGYPILEPCVGDGAIAGYLKQYQLAPITNDIDKKRKADYHYDMRNPRLYEAVEAEGGLEWCVMNPPFNIIDEMLKVTLEHCTHVIALARLSVLEPTEARRFIYKYYQPDMLIVLPRYCFRLNDKGERSTDSVTCAWIGFGPEVPRITTVWTEEPPDETKEKRR